ncbi:MAG: hypothetical protein U5K84_11910 [Alkalibacterium sp.]|nr:hypothetical protein [Alkalibacterium sp.]
MNKNILLIGLAAVFLLLFDAYVSSELEQASYVDIPPIESVRESREEQQNENTTQPLFIVFR